MSQKVEVWRYILCGKKSVSKRVLSDWLLDERLLIDVPQLGRFVARHGEYHGACGVPAQAVDAARMCVGHRPERVAALALVNDELAVGAAAGEALAIGRIAHSVDEALVFGERALPLERRSLEVAHAVVLAGDDGSQGPRRLEVHRVDGLRGAHDLADARARLGVEDVAELLATLATAHQALIVARPLQVLDAAGERLELVLEYVLLVGRVPDAHLAGRVGRGDVEARRRVLGHLNGLRVLRVHVALGRLGYVAYEHAVAVHVQEVFALRVAAEDGERASRGARQRGVDVLQRIAAAHSFLNCWCCCCFCCCCY